MDPALRAVIAESGDEPESQQDTEAEAEPVPAEARVDEEAREAAGQITLTRR